MKRVFLLLSFVIVLIFSSCSSDIDLYAEYKDMPIIYGLLDAIADTNFIKITRAMYVQGDAYQVAVNPDSSNYPGKLDVRLVEYCNGDSIREIVFDTITVHDKQPGIFYAPSQKLYYTTEPLSLNGKNANYSYRLTIVLPQQTIVTEAKLVGNAGYDVQSLAVNFSEEYFGTRRPFLFRPAINAGFYHVSMAFTFLEQRTPDDDSVPRTMTWDLGYWDDYYLSTHLENGCYVFYYRPEPFYEMLRDFIGGDTAIAGLKRYITDYPVEITIAAGGEKLQHYIYTNSPSNGFLAGDIEFSQIDGGYGVFSSRMIVKRKVRMGGTTVPELVARRYWGFKYIGGE
jgi:hypothetical protein